MKNPEKFEPKIEKSTEEEKEKEAKREDIETEEEKEIQTIEQSPLETGKKLDLALLCLERKKAAYVGSHTILETETKKEEILEKFTKELEDVQETLDELGLPYQTTRVPKIEDEAIIGFSVSVGRNKEDLSKFIEAEKQGNDKEMGLLLGYPKTAVEVYNTDKALNFETFFQQELSKEEQEELREEGVLKFLGFQPSREHWREELEQARYDQALIKEKAPRLYEEIMESEDLF